MTTGDHLHWQAQALVSTSTCTMSTSTCTTIGTGNLTVQQWDADIKIEQ